MTDTATRGISQWVRASIKREVKTLLELRQLDGSNLTFTHRAMEWAFGVTPDRPVPVTLAEELILPFVCELAIEQFTDEIPDSLAEEVLAVAVAR